MTPSRHPSSSFSTYLVPRPHFSSRPKRFRSRDPCENVPRPFVSDTSLKRIDREGLGKRRTGTRQYPALEFSNVSQNCDFSNFFLAILLLRADLDISLTFKFHLVKCILCSFFLHRQSFLSSFVCATQCKFQSVF